MSQDSFFDNNELHLLQYSQTGKIIGQKNNRRSQPDGSSSPAFNSTIRYEVEKSGNDWLTDSNIVVNISAITGSGGTYIRAVNCLALFLFKRYELVLDNDILETNYPECVHSNLKNYSNSDKYSCISQQLAIGSTSTRNTLAGSAQILVIPLRLLFSLFAKPFDRAMIEGKLEVKMYLRDNVRYCIQTDKSSPTFSITDTYLDLEYTRPNPTIINSVRTMYNQNDLTGIPYFDIDHEIVEQIAETGDTSANIKLSTLVNKRIVDIQVFARASALSDIVDASDYTDTYIAPTSFNLKAGNKYLNYGLEENITKEYYDRVILPGLKLPGWVNLLNGTASGNEFIISFASDHGAESSEFKRYHGSRFFTEQNAILTVNFSALAADTDIICIVRSAGRFVVNNGSIQHL